MSETYNHTYGAGMKHGQVKVAAGTVYDIDAIINIEGEPEQETTEIPGDDTIKATFASGRKENITITANAVSMDVIAAITGNTATDVTGIGSTVIGKSIPLGTDAELNPPFVEVKAQITGKTDEGTSVNVIKTWHKVQLNSFTLGAGNGSEMSITLSGTAVRTDKEIDGTTSLSPARVATLEVSNAE